MLPSLSRILAGGSQIRKPFPVLNGENMWSKHKLSPAEARDSVLGFCNSHRLLKKSSALNHLEDETKFDQHQLLALLDDLELPSRHVVKLVVHGCCCRFH